MSDVHGRKLGVLCYIEGYRIPIKSISISCQQGLPSIATINIPPTPMAGNIQTTTHIVMFVRYSAFGNNSPLRDQYMLMFHGEITGVRSSKNGSNMTYQIMAVDSRTYLNKLPSRMLYKLYSSGTDFFPNIKDDASFYGIPEGDAITAYFDGKGVLTDSGKSSLVDYINRILSLMKYYGTSGYSYYANANFRYNIKDNHSVRDFGDTFENLWGSITKSCVLNNTTQRIIESHGTTMEALASNLGPMGYMYVSTLFPRFVSDSKGKRLVEYIITRDLINQRAPKFNYIFVDRDDNFDAMIIPTRITALKYKYKVDQSTYPVDNDIYPKNCMDGGVTGRFHMTEEEMQYGVSRESVEMDYYYNAFLKGDGAAPKSYKSGDPKTNLEKKIAYDFIVKRTESNSLSIAKSGFYPQYVIGMPTVVYDPMTERMYRGNISRIAYSIDPESGSCVTSLEAINAMKINKRTDIDIDREDVNPFGKAEFKEEEISFYKDHFYGDREDKDILLDSISIGNGALKMADYEKIIDRPMCTMREYLSMYYAKDYVQQDSIPEDLFGDYVSAKGSGDTALSYQTFATNAETVFFKLPVKEKIYFLFIEDRRIQAKRLQQALWERILYV